MPIIFCFKKYRNLTKSYSNKYLSFRITEIFILLVILQIIPITGVFLMMTAAMLWVGFIPHIIAVALYVDLYRNKAKAIFFLIPIIPYLFYYSFMFYENEKIKTLQADLRSQNPATIIQYNPDIHSLVDLGDASLRWIVQRYKIPVTYIKNKNFESYTSYRLLTKDLCIRSKEIHESVYTSSITQYKNNKKYEFRNICNIRLSEEPTKQLLKVQRTTHKKDKNLKEIHFNFLLNNKELGTFKSMSYKALPVFPHIVIGCGLVSSVPAWECVAQIKRESKPIDTFPINNELSRNKTIIPRLLGIDAYENKELANFNNYDHENARLYDLIKRKENETPDDFDEWGLRYDSIYIPKIGKERGYSSFRGFVSIKNKGGHFVDFIRENNGKIIYLDIQVVGGNQSADSFTLYGICKPSTECNVIHNRYKFKKEDTSEDSYYDGQRRYHGFFFVNDEEKHKRRIKDEIDVSTVLTVILEDNLENTVQ